MVLYVTRVTNLECRLHSSTSQHSSYMRGQQTTVVYNFLPNAAPGQKILEAPHNLIYLPVTVDVISTLAVWLTDQDGEHLDLRGEKLTIRSHLRER